MRKGDIIEHKTEGYMCEIVFVLKNNEVAMVEVYDCPVNVKIWGAVPFKTEVELKYFKNYGYNKTK